MAYRACCTSCGASLRRPGLTVSADRKACRRGTHLLDDARSAFPLPGQDVCEEGLHDSGEIARNAFELLNKVIAQREIDRRLARCTGAATLRSHTFGDGQCALLGGPIDTSALTDCRSALISRIASSHRLSVASCHSNLLSRYGLTSW